MLEKILAIVAAALFSAGANTNQMTVKPPPVKTVVGKQVAMLPIAPKLSVSKDTVPLPRPDPRYVDMVPDGPIYAPSGALQEASVSEEADELQYFKQKIRIGRYAIDTDDKAFRP